MNEHKIIEVENEKSVSEDNLIIDGKNEHIGKLVNVHIDNYNQNTLFGKITSLKYKAA